MDREMKTVGIKSSSALSASDAFTLAALCITFVWTILSTYVFHMDGAGRVQIFFLLTALLMNANVIFKRYLKGPLLIYALISVYMFINGIVQDGHLNFEADPYLQMFKKAITPSVFMLLCAYMLDRHQRTTVRALYFSMLFYLFLYIVFLRAGQRQINENTAALVMIATALLLGFGYLKGLFSFRHLVVSSTFLMMVAVMLGSRMGLSIMIFIYLMFVINYFANSSRKLNYFWVVVFIGIITAFFLFFVLKFTEVGARLLSTTSQSAEMRTDLQTGTILDVFGDRGIQYFFSWPYFLKSPVFGIGFCNWIRYNPQEIVCHSEYLVQYLENGLVSFIPYVLFIFSLMHSLRKQIKGSKGMFRSALRLVMVAMIGVILCNFVIWTNDQYSVFTMYALCYVLGHPRRTVVTVKGHNES